MSGRRLSADENGIVYACPECDVAGDVYERAGNGTATAGDTSARYLCHTCGATFNECRRRDTKQRDAVPTFGLARTLWEMDAEEVLGD